MGNRWKITALAVLLFGLLKTLCWCMDARGPRILQNLPDGVEFSNDTGATIECRTQGNPTPTIKWVRADGSIVSSTSGLRDIFANGSLHFKPFSAQDYRQDIHDSVYKCMAVNLLGTVISNDVRVTAAVKQGYEIQVYDQYVIQGNTAVLKCHIPSFMQGLIVFTSWEKENHKAPETVTENGRYSLFPDGVLHIRDVRRDGSSFRYRCRTQHRLTGEIKRSASAGKVIVTEPSGNISPQIAHSRGTVEAWQGEKVRLPCVAQGLPIPQYRWEKLRDSHSSGIKLGEKSHIMDGTLVIRNVQIEDSGTYICIANNSAGLEKAETMLTVIVALSAYIQPELQEVDEGKPATFACTTSGHPVTFVSWIKDGHFLTMDDRVKLLSREILRIEAVRREDRGMYQCIARNDRFSVQATAELKLGDSVPVFLHTFREQTIHAGNSLSLKCVASGNPPLMAKWTLDDVEIVSADFVNVRDDTVSYVNISKATTEDGGEYTCVMSNRVGTIRHSAQINVHGPPIVRVMSNVSAVAERDAILKCRAAGYPIDSIHWEKDGHTLPINHRHKVFPNGTLIIQQVNRITDAGYYSCVATNRQGQSAQRPVHLSVLNAPVINPFSFPMNLRAGVRAGIQCLIIEGDQPISITWLKDDRPIPPDRGITTKTLDDLTRSLIINSITPWHNGNYTCVASNGADSVKHTAQLFVNVPPQWIVEPRNSSVILHRTHHLDCQADGSPNPVITWKKAIGRTPRDYKLVSQVSMNVQEARNGSLLIRGSQEAHEGYYLCQVSNGVAPELSKVIYLDVQVPAYFEEKLRNQSVVKGRDVVLSCVAKGDDPIAIQWKTTDKLISSNLPRFTVKERPGFYGITSELVISRLDRRDTNVYQCEATNPYGKDISKIYLLVKEPPEAPKSPIIVSKSSRNMHLSWKNPFDGNSPIIKYIVQYRTESETWDKAQNVTVSGNELSTFIKNIRPATKYPIRVFAENDIGIGMASVVVMVTTDEEAPEGSPLDVQIIATDSRSLKVTWKPPKKELWNGEIQGYRIGYREYDSLEPFVFKTYMTGSSAENLLQYLLNDLKKFTKYVIVIEAYNNLGTGPRTSELGANTLEDVPSKPPYAVKCATLSSRSIRIEWEPPPPSSQHGILLGYKISYMTVDKVKEERSLHTASSQNTVIDNLQRFTNYSIRVLAFNSAGDGKMSEAIYCRTEEDVPGAPHELKALVMSSDAVLLSWRPPSNPNGIITKYTVYMRADGHGNLKPMSHTVPPTQLYYEARGLEEELHYEFWITASTAIGEGDGTAVVSQSPTSIVPARIASFPEHIVVNKKDDIKLECRAVGIPTPDREWRVRGERIQEKARFRTLFDGSLFISSTRVHDSGNYSCRVINIYATDEIHYELIVRGPQGKDIPSTPILEVKVRTKASLTLEWSVEDDGKNQIRGYTLNYKENSDEWKELHVSADNESYTFEDLKCGTRYQFYITASNRIGTSEPSDVVVAATQGHAPDKPSRDAFIRVNATSISLNFNTWSDGGCPITDFIIEYRMKDDTEWEKMVHGATATQKYVHIGGLRPASLYTVRVTARNEAGYTTAEYDIMTLLDGTERDISEYSMDKSSSDLLNYLDLNIIIPVATIAAIIIIAVVVICSVFQCRRYFQNKTGGSARHVIRALASSRASRRREAERPSPTSSKPETKKTLTNDPTGYRESGVHDDICPYATYKLPTCNTSDLASMQLKTFSHVKSSSEESWPQVKVLQTKLIHSRKDPSTLQDGGIIHRKGQGNSTPSQPPYDDSSGQLSWFPESAERVKESHQLHCQPSSLIPSAPPAEGDSSLSDSENTEGDGATPSSPPKDLRLSNIRTKKSKPFHRVPDLLYHRQDSSTSNEDSPYRDQITLTPEDIPRERILSLRHPRISSSRQNSTSAETTPDDPPFETIHAPPGFGDKFETSANSEVGKTESSATKTDRRNKTSRNLAAEEEELIALLKRGHMSGEQLLNRKEERGGLFNLVK